MLLISSVFLLSMTPQQAIEQAQQASTFFEQQQALDVALEQLLASDTRNLNESAAMAMETVLGEIYVVREQLPLASLHYRRALKRIPWSHPTREKLNEILVQLNQPLEPSALSIPYTLSCTFFFTATLFFSLSSLFLFGSLFLQRDSFSLCRDWLF